MSSEESSLAILKRELPFFITIGITLVFVTIMFFVYDGHDAKWDGIAAPSEPIQTTDDQLPEAFSYKKYTITPVAHFSIHAIVLNCLNYTLVDNDYEAELVPVDLAVGWEVMSIAENINSILIFQSNRFAHFFPRSKSVLTLQDILSHATNIHCIPANKEVEDSLLSVSRYDLVKMKGYLVNAVRPDGYGVKWTSSLTRDDSGPGGCEVFWITEIFISKP